MTTRKGEEGNGRSLCTRRCQIGIWITIGSRVLLLPDVSPYSLWRWTMQGTVPCYGTKGNKEREEMHANRSRVERSINLQILQLLRSSNFLMWTSTWLNKTARSDVVTVKIFIKLFVDTSVLLFSCYISIAESNNLSILLRFFFREDTEWRTTMVNQKQKVNWAWTM